MSDQYLAALVRAVEDGVGSPPLWMTLHSGDLVTGTPHSSRAFVEGTFDGIFGRTDMRTREGAPERERKEVVKQYADWSVRPFNVTVDTTRADAVTLADATVYWGGRSGGVKVPFVRLQLSSVALWWVTGGEEFKGSTPTFFGVAVSI